MAEINLLQKPAETILIKLGIKYIHLENSSESKHRYNNNVKYKGLPDLIIFFKNGKVVFIEFKILKNELKTKQIEWKEYLEKKGYDYYLIYDNINLFYEIIKKYI